MRAATLENAYELARVHVGGRTWTYRGLVPTDRLDSVEERRQREEMWARFVTQPSERTLALLAECEGAGVGLLSAGPSRDDDADDAVAEVYSIYLRSQDLAGTGIGRELWWPASSVFTARGFARPFFGP